MIQSTNQVSDEEWAVVHHLVRAGHRPGQGRVHIGGGDRNSREAISLARHRHRRALLRNGRLRERIHAHATTAASCCWCGFLRSRCCATTRSCSSRRRRGEPESAAAAGSRCRLGGYSDDALLSESRGWVAWVIYLFFILKNRLLSAWSSLVQFILPPSTRKSGAR